MREIKVITYQNMRLTISELENEVMKGALKGGEFILDADSRCAIFYLSADFSTGPGIEVKKQKK